MKTLLQVVMGLFSFLVFFVVVLLIGTFGPIGIFLDILLVMGFLGMIFDEPERKRPVVTPHPIVATQEQIDLVELQKLADQMTRLSRDSIALIEEHTVTCPECKALNLPSKVRCSHCNHIFD